MSDHKALFKHSRNYLFAELASKALAFVSIPVYTRLLSVEEYGVMGVFMSLVGIAVVLFTLSTDVAISRYYYDRKDDDDFKSFVGSTITLTMIVLCFTITVFILLLPFLSDKLSFPKRLTFCLLPVALYQATNQVFTQIYNPMMKSQKIAIVSSIQVYLAFALSVVFMLSLQSEKYYGYVYGNITAMAILGIYLYKQIRPYCIFSFKKSYYKYILNYCLPYIPYTLSGVILSQFSRIFIGQDQGFSLAGSYTLTTNIAALMLIVLGVTHSAWNPYYFRYMNEKDTVSIDNDYNLIWRITLTIAFSIAAFGNELAIVLSKGDEYLITTYVMPFLVLGYCFYQWAYVYLRNTGYVKRNIWNAVCVVISGTANAFLNSLFVPEYKEMGAAVATCLSFFLLMIVGYLTNKFIIKAYSPSFWNFLKIFIIVLPLFFAVFMIHIIDIDLLIKIPLKLVLFVGLLCLIMLPYRSKMYKFKNKYFIWRMK